MMVLPIATGKQFWEEDSMLNKKAWTDKVSLAEKLTIHIVNDNYMYMHKHSKVE